MKFARYLEETQIPEWKKAYIDYRGLKKLITAIRRANDAAKTQDRNSDTTPRQRGNRRSSVTTQPSPGNPSFTPKNYGAVGRTPPNALGRSSVGTIRRTPPAPASFTPTGPTGRTPPFGSKSGNKIASFRASHDELGPDFELPPAMESTESLKNTLVSQGSPTVERRRAVPSRYFSETLTAVSSRSDGPRQSQESFHPSPVPLPAAAAPVSEIPQTEPRSRRLYSFSGMRRRMTMNSRSNEFAYSPPAPSNVEELLAGLGPNEIAFFTAFDRELDKVDAFYSEREQDAMLKVAALKEQFKELRGHKQLTGAEPDGLWPGFLNLLDSINIPSVLPIPHNAGKSPDTSLKTDTPQPNPQLHAGPSMMHDPDAYQRAKKKLKKAVLEFYRGLELLQNYRILNMTGFRKALKKFDKTTKVSSQALYMREKVETRRFASGETCDYLLKEIEQIYAARFEKGDAKKARARLRATHRETTHHFSTFRSGMLLGLSIPALAMGIYY
ncbi:SPX-domain-containing protein [Ceratobasidium sp. AG-I]|nr:SPX-domain-containing protein [Ceratobasidium sp. AG-I]